jgi:hypothetical protein
MPEGNEKRTAEQVIEELERRMPAGCSLERGFMTQLAAIAIVADMSGLDPLAAVARELGVGRRVSGLGYATPADSAA